ncbi:MAG: homocysteine S-methyltransferase family protein, partial [Clostridia bacterium]|nr:homocysteine S-methyltransferase family protein [Clostridia bacterium]
MDLVALIASGVVQFDGGFGSLAAERNLSADCPERLNLTRPDGVRGIHRAYVEAGAQVIETNTLGANWARLAQHGLERDAERIVRAAVRLAREAGAEVVACSMGTSAEFLEPFGTLSLESAVRGFTAQAKAAKDAGADLLFTETLTDVAESRAMWMAAQAVGLPFGASFTFLENGRTLTGNPPEVCALIAESAGAALLGVNCVGDPALLLRCVEAMRAVSKLPVVAQPNAGIPERADGALQYPMTPDAMLTVMREAVRRGAAAVGGCCGTTP